MYPVAGRHGRRRNLKLKNRRKIKKLRIRIENNFKLEALDDLLFGFLLQKGGVAKYNVLTRALLLEDFAVMKVMLTAVVVGIIQILKTVDLSAQGNYSHAMMVYRQSAALFGLILCLVWANHCIVTRAFASSEPNKATHCNHHKENEKSQKKGCDQNGCCQPGLSSSPAGSLEALIVLDNSLPFPKTFFAEILTLRSSLKVEKINTNSTGPPGELADIISSLSVAQNAPPVC